MTSVNLNNFNDHLRAYRKAIGNEELAQAVFTDVRKIVIYKDKFELRELHRIVKQLISNLTLSSQEKISIFAIIDSALDDNPEISVPDNNDVVAVLTAKIQDLIVGSKIIADDPVGRATVQLGMNHRDKMTPLAVYKPEAPVISQTKLMAIHVEQSPLPAKEEEVQIKEPVPQSAPLMPTLKPVAKRDNPSATMTGCEIKKAPEKSPSSIVVTGGKFVLPKLKRAAKPETLSVTEVGIEVKKAPEKSSSPVVVTGGKFVLPKLKRVAKPETLSATKVRIEVKKAPEKSSSSVVVTGGWFVLPKRTPIVRLEKPSALPKQVETAAPIIIHTVQKPIVPKFMSTVEPSKSFEICLEPYTTPTHADREELEKEVPVCIYAKEFIEEKFFVSYGNNQRFTRDRNEVPRARWYRALELNSKIQRVARNREIASCLPSKVNALPLDLQALSLEGGNIGDVGLSIVTKKLMNCRSLRRLNLAGNGLTSASFVSFKEIASLKIEELYVGDNEDVCASLQHRFLLKTTSLMKLDLSQKPEKLKNFIATYLADENARVELDGRERYPMYISDFHSICGRAVMPLDAGVNISKYIQENFERKKTSIERAALAKFQERAVKEVAILVEAFMANPLIPLTELNLQYMCIGAKGIDLLGKWLANNETLQKLNLMGNQIKTHDAKALAEIVKWHPTIREINLQDNLLDQSAVFVAFEPLSKKCRVILDS